MILSKWMRTVGLGEVTRLTGRPQLVSRDSAYTPAGSSSPADPLPSWPHPLARHPSQSGPEHVPVGMGPKGKKSLCQVPENVTETRASESKLVNFSDLVFLSIK